MDITYYEHSFTRDGKTSVIRSMTEEPSRGFNTYTLDKTERVTLHLEVGTPVLVQAFGRRRGGVVTGLGRTKVKVRFIRNQHGEPDERSFGAWDVSPFDDTPHDRTPL